MRLGYCRVSSSGQSVDIQIEELNRHACERIVQEKVSGRDLDNRPALKGLLEFVRKDDELFVTRIDRLARSVPDLCAIAEMLDKKGVRLVITQQQMDTASSYGRFMLHVLGAVAEFESVLRGERQRAGIDAWKEKLRSGEATLTKRTPKFDPAEIRRLHHHNMKPRAIAKKLKCSAQTVYRVLELGANNPVKRTIGEINADSIGNVRV